MAWFETACHVKGEVGHLLARRWSHNGFLQKEAMDKQRKHILFYGGAARILL